MRDPDYITIFGESSKRHSTVIAFLSRLEPSDIYGIVETLLCYDSNQYKTTIYYDGSKLREVPDLFKEDKSNDVK